MPLTVNAVMHRQNLYPPPTSSRWRLISTPTGLRQCQYYGWALKNRALMPTIAQIEGPAASSRKLRCAEGVPAIDYVVRTIGAASEKCMGGWGRQFFNISPAGKIPPCHAETITGLEFRRCGPIIRSLDLANRRP
jgi:pyrroloquinoline quinone biosynthesis protein E